MSFKTLIEWLFIVWILLWKWLQACVSWIFSFIASVIFDLMRLSYTTILINYHCLNFVERHSFRRVSGKSPETMRELCLSTKFPQQEIKWNYGILLSVRQLTSQLCHSKFFWLLFDFLIRKVFVRFLSNFFKNICISS